MIYIWQLHLTDGEQIAVARQCLHVSCSLDYAKRRDMKIATLPNLTGGRGINNDRRELRQEVARGNQRLCQPIIGRE